MKLSVIVPVYNVEKYLPRCLDSLLCQGMNVGEYEVICVNDGSPDNCATILAEYEARHPDVFKVIIQENKGLGCARNTGMRMVRGEWIAFVDSDDYLVDGAYKYLLDHFCKEGVDVVAFGNHYVHTDGFERPYSEDSIEGHVVYEGDGVEYYNKDELPYVWSKLYRRMFLQENVMSFKSIYLEDTLFVFQLFSHHPYLVYTDSKVYGYEQSNATSQMHQVEKGNVLNQLDGLLCGAEYLNSYLLGQDAPMTAAALRGISIYVDHFYRKAFRIHLTWKEWRGLFKRLKRMPIHKAAETSRTSKKIARLKNLSGHSYVNYLVISYYYKKHIYRKGVR